MAEQRYTHIIIVRSELKDCTGERNRNLECQVVPQQIYCGLQQNLQVPIELRHI